MSEIETGILWKIIIGGMLVTYATRISFIALIPQERLPALFKRGLHYVMPSILAALILPALTQPFGELDLSFGNSRLLAGLLASLIAWRTKNTWLTIAVGMSALWLFDYLG